MLESPGTLLALTAPGQLLCGTHRTSQRGRQERRLEEAAFAQCLELLLSNKPKLKEQDPDLLEPAHLVCVPAGVLDRVPGDRACGFWKSSKVGVVSQSHSVMSPCSKEPFTVCYPARKLDAPKRESLLRKIFWYLPAALQASFHLCLITEAKAIYLLPYSAVASYFSWSSPLRHLEKPLLPVASLGRFSSKQSFKPYCLMQPNTPLDCFAKGWLVLACVQLTVHHSPALAGPDGTRQGLLQTNPVQDPLILATGQEGASCGREKVKIFGRKTWWAVTHCCSPSADIFVLEALQVDFHP